MDIKIVILILFAAVSAAHLVSYFFKNMPFRAITKALLVPLCLAVYLTGADIILLPVVLALIFGWLGDVFLVKISNLVFFRLGLASFLLGHICYIIAMFRFGSPFHVPSLIVSVIAAAALGAAIFNFIRPAKEMKIPVIAYEVVIMTMAVFALQLFLAQEAAFGAFILAGSVCFVVSDTSLAFVTFRKKSALGDFFVMLTYIAAQFLLTWGFCAIKLA